MAGKVSVSEKVPFAGVVYLLGVNCLGMKVMKFVVVVVDLVVIVVVVVVVVDGAVVVMVVVFGDVIMVVIMKAPVLGVVYGVGSLIDNS